VTGRDSHHTLVVVFGTEQDTENPSACLSESTLELRLWRAVWTLLILVLVFQRTLWSGGSGGQFGFSAVFA
jgi:hypothetical protein